MSDRRRNTVRIDYDRLAEAIVKAELQVDEERTAKAEGEHEQLQEKWQSELGFDENAKGIKAFFNDLKVLKNIILMKKEQAITLAANNLLLKLLLIGIYKIFELSIYFVVVVSVAVAIKFHTYLFAVCFAIVIIVLGVLIARIIRIARFEIDNITDKNYLATLFAAVMSFIAIIVSAIAIAISIIYKG